jgi:hypothetical protein
VSKTSRAGLVLGPTRLVHISVIPSDATHYRRFFHVFSNMASDDGEVSSGWMAAAVYHGRLRSSLDEGEMSIPSGSFTPIRR